MRHAIERERCITDADSPKLRTPLTAIKLRIERLPSHMELCVIDGRDLTFGSGMDAAASMGARIARPC